MLVANGQMDNNCSGDLAATLRIMQNYVGVAQIPIPLNKDILKTRPSKAHC